MADNPNAGPDPVDTQPNHLREKTYQDPNPPKKVDQETQRLPEKATEEKVREDMPKAVNEVKKRL